MTWKRQPPWRTILKDRPGGGLIPPAARTPFERETVGNNRKARRAASARKKSGGPAR